MRSVKQKAYAKINLSLDILGRLENGYHIVKMVMQTINLSDELIFETQDRECRSMEITLVTDSGEIPGGGATVAYTNDLSLPIATGVELRLLGGAVLFALGTGGLLLLMRTQKRRKKGAHCK